MSESLLRMTTEEFQNYVAWTVLSGEPSSGVVYANIHPDVLAQLDRIEAMLKALTDLPHNKRYDLDDGK